MWPFQRDTNNAVPTYVVDNTIDAGTVVRGDVKGPGGFSVEGTIEGSLEAGGPVVIGEGGGVDGSVSGRDVVVLGRVRGDIRASGHLEIGPNGKVLGDVTVASFRMHKGGVFRGTSKMPGAEDLAPPAGLLAAKPKTERSDKTQGRTLPPPNGAVVPPPARLPPPPPPPLPPLAAEAASHERLVTSDFTDEAKAS